MKVSILTSVAVLAYGVIGTTSAIGSIIVTGNSYSVSAGTLVSAQFSVSNSSSATSSDIEGMTFTAQIADGSGTSPKITSIDLLTGTIWNGHVSTGSISTPAGGNQAQYQSRDLFTDIPGDFVNANGLLATVMIDTTGAGAGDYAIKLTGTKTAGNDSTFLDGVGNVVTASFGQGDIMVTVPEPNTVILALIASTILVGYRFRTVSTIIASRSGL